MANFTLVVNYSYRTYAERTIVVQADSWDDIGEREIAAALISAGSGFSDDEELQINDWTEEG